MDQSNLALAVTIEYSNGNSCNEMEHSNAIGCNEIDHISVALAVTR